MSAESANAAASEAEALEAFERQRAERLKRGAHLYSQVLLCNAEWGFNSQEDQSFFETLYFFLARVVQLCLREGTTDHTGSSAGGGGATSGAARSKTSSWLQNKVVDEEIQRLFRSEVFSGARRAA